MSLMYIPKEDLMQELIRQNSLKKQLLKMKEKMTNLTHPTYIKLRDLILASEGNTLEDELGFWCYFRWNGDLWFINCMKCIDGRIFAFSCSGSAHSWPDYMTENETMAMRYQIFHKEDIKDFEILGLPISLERVLIVLGASGFNGDEMRIDKDIVHFSVWFNFGWKLGKPLHEQSQEVWEKLIEILEDNQK